jgi:hypothetical protein
MQRAHASGLRWCYHDGGRAAAGYKGKARDCATRAIAIATGLQYQAIYAKLIEAVKREDDRRRQMRNHPRTGMRKSTVDLFLRDLGWNWISTTRANRRTCARLRAPDLPTGRIIVALARHVCTIIDGVIYDTHDPSREGRKPVYGYWLPPPARSRGSELSI